MIIILIHFCSGYRSYNVGDWPFFCLLCFFNQPHSPQCWGSGEESSEWPYISATVLRGHHQKTLPNCSANILLSFTFPSPHSFSVSWAKLDIWINSINLSSATQIYILYRGVPRPALTNLVPNLCLMLWVCYLVFFFASAVLLFIIECSRSIIVYHFLILEQFGRDL